MGVLLGLPRLSAAATTVGVRATVADNLQAIDGQVVVRGDELRLAMPLSELPVPQDDVLLRRTFPQAPQQGLAHLGPAIDGIASFSTVMPPLGIEIPDTAAPASAPPICNSMIALSIGPPGAT